MTQKFKSHRIVSAKHTKIPQTAMDFLNHDSIKGSFALVLKLVNTLCRICDATILIWINCIRFTNLVIFGFMVYFVRLLFRLLCLLLFRLYICRKLALLTAKNIFSMEYNDIYTSCWNAGISSHKFSNSHGKSEEFLHSFTSLYL